MLNKNKIAIFLAARSGSKRLPNKHFLKINSDLRVIDLCILRLKKTKLVNKIFLCTTREKRDNKFNNICKKHNIKLFRGSTNNVAKRIIDRAIKNSIITIIRITADCPFVDPKMLDNFILNFQKQKCDYLSNIIPPSYPDGMDIEIFNFKTLEERKAFLQGVEQSLGWQGVDWRIHDVPRKFKKEEFDNYIGGNYE